MANIEIVKPIKKQEFFNKWKEEEKNLKELIEEYSNFEVSENEILDELKFDNENLYLISKKENKKYSYELTGWLREQNSVLSYQEFYDDIKDSAENDYPSFFFTRNAGQVYTASFQHALAQLELIKKDPNFNNKKLKDVILVIDTLVNDYEKTISEEQSTQRFDFKFLLDKYGDVVERKISNDLSKSRLGVLNDTKYLSNYKWKYNIQIRNNDEILNFLDFYLKNGVKKFNFYIPDISFQKMKREVKNTLFKYANKIVLLSDGNSQPWGFYEKNYLEWVKKQEKFYSPEELEKIWNDYQEGKSDEILNMDYQHFYRTKNKMKIFHLDGSYAKSLYDDKIKKGALTIYNSPLSHIGVKENLKLTNEFSSDIFKLNKIENTSLETMTLHNFSKYNENKKNLIFIGSSLFKKYWSKWDENNPVKKEFNAVFDKIKTLYPPSEYNYIFKLHPAFNKNEDIIGYINKITNNFEDAIILKNYNWEAIMDYEMSKIKNNEKSWLFSKDDFKNDKNSSKTTLWGMQGTTTVIMSSLKFLESSLQLPMKNFLSFVNPRNFPVSNTFDIIIKGGKFLGQEENHNKINEVYKYFISTGAFFDATQHPFINVQDFLKLKNK